MHVDWTKFRMTFIDHPHYQLIATAIQYLADNYKDQPSLEELSKHLHISESHLQRTFSQWAGVSPKQFLQYLTKEYAKEQLRHSPVLQSALNSGLSGSSRLHDLFIKYESMTPGEYRIGGQGLDIHYGVCHSPFGYCFIAATDRGVCKLAFLEDEKIDDRLNELQQEWPAARYTYSPDRIIKYSQQVFQNNSSAEKPRLLLKGTRFQLQVWEALLELPEGDLVSYQHIADALGKPKAVRAVASAIARNNIAYLIPCHRVIRSTGVINQYRWGAARKLTMIAWEAIKKADN